MLKAAVITAAGLDIGLVIIVVDTFEPGWLFTVAAFCLGFVMVVLAFIIGRQVYRTGYWQARGDTFTALSEAMQRNLSIDEWLNAETERDRSRAQDERPFWRRGG